MTDVSAVAFADLDREMATTRRVLERLPTDRLGWRPHEKSMTLGALGTHVADLLGFWRATLTTDGMDVSRPIPTADTRESTDEILALWDRNEAALREAVTEADGDVLAAPWPIRAGERVLSSDPRHLAMRIWGLSHIVHHRGQLTVYLRLLDVSVPGVYGPSADER